MDATPAGGAAHDRGALEAVLALLGAAMIAAPYLARPLGLGVEVPASREVADHVIPGTLVMVLGLVLLRLRRRAASGWGVAVAGGACFLAGFFNVATHVPLLAAAASGDERWGAALWHASTGPFVVVLGLAAAFRSGPGDPARA